MEIFTGLLLLCFEQVAMLQSAVAYPVPGLGRFCLRYTKDYLEQPWSALMRCNPLETTGICILELVPSTSAAADTLVSRI